MELFRALAALLEPPSPALAPIAAAVGFAAPPRPDDHTNVLVFQAYPYASVYCGHEGMLGGDARDRISGFWRALGSDAPVDADHLGTLFSACAQLADRERESADLLHRAQVRRARHALFWEHVASWMPPYLELLRRIDRGFYAAWADLAEATVAAEALTLGPPSQHAAHLRAAVALPADVANLDELLAIMLAPARVGFTVVRDDLLRASAELGLGCRVGERRYALRSLLDQDAAAVLGWLSAEADRQAAAYQRSPLPAVRTWWELRAQASASWLAHRAADAGALTRVAIA